MSTTISKKEPIRTCYGSSIVRYAKAICFAFLLAGVHLLQAQTTSNALDFDGEDDYVQLPAAHYFTQNNFTIEAWVYPKSYNLWSRVIDFSNGPASDNVLTALTDGTSGHPAGYIFNGGNGTNFTANGTLALDTWSHLAIVVSESNAAIYINGELDTDFTDINQVNDIERTLNYIGKSPWTDDYADMILDELKIWSAALTASAIADNMHKKPAANQPGLLVYFDFDQGVQEGDNTSVTSLIDKSGNDYHGTFNNFTLDGAGSNFVAGVDVSEGATYTFAPLVNTQTTITKNVSDAAFDITATSTSPAPFTYSLQSGTSISLNGATATITGPGTSVVRISQAAVAGFAESHTDVTILITTIPATLTATTVPQSGGLNPVSIANGDLNGDGFNDMAVTFEGTHNVTIYTNDGTGAFSTSVPYAVGSIPWGIAISDVDGDGNLDLATANYNDNTVSVLINTGTGTFNTQVTYEVGSNPYNVAIGDFDGDGNLDLATTNFNDNTVSVLINTGTGTFNTQVTYEVGSNPYDLAIGDFDGDNNLDLATTNFNDNTVSVLINTGTGTFNTHTPYGAGSNPLSVAIGDVDSDGKLDLAATNYDNGTVSVLTNTGTGTFNTQVTYAVGSSPFDLAIGDVDGDGNLDLETANQDDNTVSVLVNTGTGTFNTQVTYEVGSSPRGLTIGDWNGDAQPDLATANNGGNSLSIILNTGSGVFGNTTNINTGSYYNSLAVGDLNDDGKGDLVIGTQGNALLVKMNLGNNTYTSPAAYEIGGQQPGVAIGDLDGDGKLDLAATNYDNGTVSVLINTGTGTFNTQVTYEVGPTPFGIAMGDLDADGKLDLATANYNDNTVSVLINTGTGTFNTQVTYVVGDEPTSVAMGDLDGDGNLDLATANSADNTVSVLINTGTGTFNTQVEYAAGLTPFSIAIGDLDGDGKPDLATANYNDNTVSVLINTGTGTFNTQVMYEVGANPYNVAIGDLNGDSKADLVIANADDDHVSVLNNTGDSFETEIEYNVGDNSPRSAVIADLDGDGRPDLAGVTYLDAFTFLNTTTLPQTISFAPSADKTYGDPAFTLTATGGASGNAVTYTSSNSAVATVAGSTVTIIGAGTTSIIASQTGAGFYTPATAAEQSLTVNKAPLTATAENKSRTFGVENPALTVTLSGFANGDDASDVTIPTPSVTATMVSDVGLYPITLAGGSASNYNFVLLEGTLTISKADQTITFTEIPVKTFGGGTFTLEATSSSALPITFIATNNHTTISGNTVTMISAGLEAITSGQAGNVNYNAAIEVVRTFCINPPKPTITEDSSNPDAPVLTSSAAFGNQWYLDGNSITSAITETYTVSGAGLYTVVITMGECTSDASDPVAVIITGVGFSETSSVLTLSPNPAIDRIDVTFREAGEKHIEILSADGKVMEHARINEMSAVFDVARYNTGLYLMKVQTTKGTHAIRFIKK